MATNRIIRRLSDGLMLGGRSRLVRGAPKVRTLGLDAVRIVSPVTTPLAGSTAWAQKLFLSHRRAGRTTSS